MPLLSPARTRYVVLVVDDNARSIATRLGRAPIATEVVTGMATGRRYSAILVPSGAHDAELAEWAARAGTPVVSVGRGASPAQLAAAISAVAAPVPQVDQPSRLDSVLWPEASSHPRGRAGRLVAVCGPGGTGASTLARALARAAGSSAGPAVVGALGGTEISAGRVAGRDAGLDAGRTAVQVGRAARMRVLLADFALRADQAFLCGLPDPAAALLALVETGRYRPITAVDARRHTVALAECRLLPGLRRPAHWTAVSRTGFDNLLSGVLGVFDLVVADTTGDFDGETETGSIDVEDRNHMARRTAGMADVVVVVGGPGFSGVRRLSLMVDELLDQGIDPARIQPVINRIGPEPARCASGPELARICGLPEAPIPLPLLPSILALDGLPPTQMAEPVLAAVRALFGRLPAAVRMPAPELVAPGSMGCAAS